MSPQNPFSTFADPNSFFGQPLLPRIGRALSSMFSSMGQTMGANPPMPAGIRPIPQGASVPNINPIPFLQSLNPLANRPLIGGAAQGRGPRQEPPTPTVPTFPSGRPMVGLDVYPTVPQMPPSAATPQFAGASPRPATADDLDAFYGRGAYAQQPATPVAPAAPQRVGVQTAYGMVYPTRGQEAAAQRLAQMPRMGARLASVRENIVRPSVINPLIKNIEEGTAVSGPASLEGLTQAEKIQAMRARGRQIAKNINQRNQDYFASQRGGPQPQQQTATESRPQPPQQPIAGGQTTQRSWSNYTGPNPIRGRTYSNTPSSFYGFSGSGQSMVRIPTGNGDVVYDEESGRYVPV